MKKLVLLRHGESTWNELIKHLDNVSDDEITELNVPTGQPLVYDLADDPKAIRHYYLGDEKAISAAMQAAKTA